MSASSTLRVAVPVALDRSFSYGGSASVVAGSRVLVPFGARVLVGVVRPENAKEPAAPDGEEPDESKLKDVLEVLDTDEPALSPDLVKVVEWISDYYLAPIGEAYRLALPGLLANADARVARLSEQGRNLTELGFGPGSADVDAMDRRLLEALAREGGALPASKLTKLKPRIPSVLKRVVTLEAAGLVETDWGEAEHRDARTEQHYKRTSFLREESDAEERLAKLLGRSKVRRLLLDEIESRTADEWVPSSELRAINNRAKALLDPLVEAGVLVAEARLRPLDDFAREVADVGAPVEPLTPTDEQAAALEKLRAGLDDDEFGVTLLRGITGSGKTEVYLQLIAHAREQGKGAIVLVPEIALTPQLAGRFRARFGDEVAVLHSGLTPRQRLDVWGHIRAGRRRIVIGARSAIFAPVPQLGVVVVDEEHDGSYKQEEGVRYHARDVAVVRARAVRAQVVLGSATPSLESHHNADRGRYQRLELRKRPTARPLPEVEILPLAVHRPSPETAMSARLKDAVKETVEAGEQAMLFLNRRGYTTTMTCLDCGALQACPDCSAPSMTYHLDRNRLVCHLCGHVSPAPRTCSACGSEALVHGSAGTERVEVALAAELPGVRIGRLDRDSTRGRNLVKTLEQFRRRELDVLVGTQMLSKGHDFPGVTLVGVLQGDHGLGLPDLRAAERTFQLLTQVAGRAGRGERRGRVVIQAWAIEHPALTFALRHDFEGFAEQELAARAALGNPPFGHLALVRVSGLDAQRVQTRARELGTWCAEMATRTRSKDPNERPALMVLPACAAPLERINRRTRWQLLLRASERRALRWLLEALRPALGRAGKGRDETLAMVDVDPLSLL